MGARVPSICFRPVFQSRLIAGILSCVVLLSGCARVEPGERPAQRSNLQRLKQTMVDAYKLKPDRRLLSALADVHHILTGKPRDKVNSQLESGRWLISYGGQPVGTLPQLPSFADVAGLTTKWAASLLPPAEPVSNVKLDPSPAITSVGDVNQAMAELAVANKLWREGDRTASIHRAVT